MGQQIAVEEFNGAIEEEAVKLLRSRDNWEFYLQLFDKAKGESRISVSEDELERLEAFAQETDAITIRMNPEVEL